MMDKEVMIMMTLIMIMITSYEKATLQITNLLSKGGEGAMSVEHVCLILIFKKSKFALGGGLHRISYHSELSSCFWLL